MGLYLGANALGGGGSGGGGSLLSDPREMGRVAVYQPRCEIKNTESGRGFIYSAYFSIFDAGKGGIYTTLTAPDTYVTTHNITSSTTGGGVLRLLMLPSQYQGVIGDTVTCRITLDGEEYIIETSLLQADGQGFYRPLMGNFVLDGEARTANSTGNGQTTNNFGNNYRTYWSANTPKWSNGFMPGSGIDAFFNYVPTNGHLGQIGGVRFKESLKIEFKADKTGTGSYQANTVASLVTTF